LAAHAGCLWQEPESVNSRPRLYQVVFYLACCPKVVYVKSITSSLAEGLTGVNPVAEIDERVLAD
jgi:hypothetical protein